MAQEGFLTEQGGYLKILYLGTRNSLSYLEAAAFLTTNNLSAQAVNNPTVNLVTKLGALGGGVAAVHGSQVIGVGTGPTDNVVGLYINDAAGNAYENTPAAASGKSPYVCNMGSYEVGVFETYNTSGGANIWASYVPGVPLYCSNNGLLTTAAGLTGGTAPSGAVVVGVLTKAPTPADPLLQLNLRV